MCIWQLLCVTKNKYIMYKDEEYLLCITWLWYHMMSVSITTVARWVAQEQLILPADLSTPPVVSRVRVLQS